jgi:hypothetical protein
MEIAETKEGKAAGCARFFRPTLAPDTLQKFPNVTGLDSNLLKLFCRYSPTKCMHPYTKRQ